ncbi:hypothetical protein SAMN04488074_101929 [Lentzea albidocapillata subsp. violacea]|uniref:Uncharacterized protein n=1 Tax=Lentzea albidocapillata subsp. violacea TaxID=128104 RepID=A0A1G8SCL4_9PSEU|nr:hypothetical protein [Lentzea albidocapillata]SDJ26475.1 hypothetical protein SAMN04488074_101929 [Lentzea albidocapillata subsp. violacea]
MPDRPGRSYDASKRAVHGEADLHLGETADSPQDTAFLHTRSAAHARAEVPEAGVELVQFAGSEADLVGHRQWPSPSMPATTRLLIINERET